MTAGATLLSLADAGTLRERASVYLHPGQVVVAAHPIAVTTILGSCVSVCLYDERRGVGGVNHFLLPHWVGTGAQNARFGCAAMRQLLAEVRALGGRTADLRAKVFGGACVLDAFGRADGEHLGTRNVRVALEALQTAGVPMLATDTGGRRGRRLLFTTDDGAALVRLI
jgi:chemotaxis protein CheD